MKDKEKFGEIPKYQTYRDNKNIVLVNSRPSKKESPEDLNNTAKSDSGIESIKIEENSEVKTKPVEKEVFMEENLKDEEYTPKGSAEVRVRNLCGKYF